MTRLLEGALEEGGLGYLVDPEQLLVSSGWQLLRQSCIGSAQRILICTGAPGSPPKHRLTFREFHVARLCAYGLVTKEIAAELAITSAAARGVLGRSLRKLGFRGAIQLAILWSALRRPGRLFALDGGTQWLVLECNLDAHDAPVQLTAAESGVLHSILTGESNEGIAIQRGTSVHTIANQIARLLRKFGVSSRSELAARALGNTSVRSSPIKMTIDDLQ